MTNKCSDVFLEHVGQPNGAVFHRMGVRLPQEQVQKLFPLFYLLLLPELTQDV